MVSPRNDVWESSAEIPYWWRVTTQIWVPRGTTNQKHHPDRGSDTSSVSNFCVRFSNVISRETIDGVAKCRGLFSQATIQMKATEQFFPKAML